MYFKDDAEPLILSQRNRLLSPGSFLGQVVQLLASAYTVSHKYIVFDEAPLHLLHELQLIQCPEGGTKHNPQWSLFYDSSYPSVTVLYEAHLVRVFFSLSGAQ